MIRPSRLDRPFRWTRPDPRRLAGLGLAALLLAVAAPSARAQAAEPVSVLGARKLLVVAVRFPGVEPGQGLPQVEDKARRVDAYVRNASYGKAWLEPTVKGWYTMPAPLAEYSISPRNWGVDPRRVRKLVADALGAARKDTDPSTYAAVWIVVGAFTRPGEGYGMIAYAANPGLLTGVRAGKAALESVRLAGGGTYAGPAIVSAENAHVGHVVHDLFHALGGVKKGERVVPDLYDFELQSNPPGGRFSPELFAVHTGPWDIMSQHFVERTSPPPPPSSFTRLQLGWIAPEQVAEVRPGETREFTLQPLAGGTGLLTVRVPLSRSRALLIENRQKVHGDAVLPGAGMLVLEVDTARPDGSDIVRAANANPRVPGLQAAPFVPGAGELRAYRNAAAGVAVAPLAQEADGSLRIVVTTPERIVQFLPGGGR